MPKIVDFPLAPFEKVLELANAVDYLGGTCSIQVCAEQMNKKVSGGFGLLISSAIKHDLIVRKKDRISTSELFKKLKLSYNSSEKLDFQRLSFFHPALYKRIYEKFKDKELPVSMLDKLLIREFQVEENVSAKIAGFFIEGLKDLRMLEEGKLRKYETFTRAGKQEEYGDSKAPAESKQAELTFEKQEDKLSKIQEIKELDTYNADIYSIIIKGPGIDSHIIIRDQEDYAILEAIISKIKRKFA